MKFLTAARWLLIAHLVTRFFVLFFFLDWGIFHQVRAFPPWQVLNYFNTWHLLSANLYNTAIGYCLWRFSEKKWVVLSMYAYLISAAVSWTLLLTHSHAAPGDQLGYSLRVACMTIPPRLWMWTALFFVQEPRIRTLCRGLAIVSIGVEILSWSTFLIMGQTPGYARILIALGEPIVPAVVTLLIIVETEHWITRVCRTD